jgi:hypothetical protein
LVGIESYRRDCHDGAFVYVESAAPASASAAAGEAKSTTTTFRKTILNDEV